MASSSSPDFLCSSALAVTLASELAAAVCVSCSTWRMASAICRIPTHSGRGIVWNAISSITRMTLEMRPLDSVIPCMDVSIPASRALRYRPLFLSQCPQRVDFGGFPRGQIARQHRQPGQQQRRARQKERVADAGAEGVRELGGQRRKRPRD